MSSNLIQQPYEIFTDTDGNPLEDGYIYIGEANLNPEVSPKQAYWDVELSIPAAQPIRTSGGYAYRNGSPGTLYVEDEYSITVRNKQKEMVFYAPVATSKLVSVNSFATVSSLIGLTSYSDGYTVNILGYHSANDGGGGLFNWDSTIDKSTANGGTIFDPTVSLENQGTGSGLGCWVRQYSGTVNVKWFGANGDGDDSIPFQTAVDGYTKVYIPSGSYKINITLHNRIVIIGDGGEQTKLYAYDINKATMIYGVISSKWDYSSNITGVGFHSTGKTGIGFAFGKDDVNDYVANDELKRNVVFNKCLFQGNGKGVYKPFGNIGNSFYSCGFRANKYGVYSLSNKFGETMHAGNMYFYDGEFSLNDCANYVHNTVDGFSGFVFRGTIFEANNITNYIYSSTYPYFPISYYDCWFEGNGQGNNAGTTNIDQWSDTTLSETTLDNRTLYFDGKMEVSFVGGRPTGIHCIGDNCTVMISNAPAVYQEGFGGEGFSTSGSSTISYNNFTVVGLRPAPNQNLNINFNTPIFKDLYQQPLNGNPTRAQSRSFVDYAQQKILDGGRVVEKYYSDTLEASVSTGYGSFGLTGVVVNDSPIFPTCNEYTRAAFSSSEYTALASITTPEGFCVLSYYIKCTAGSLTTATWNRSTVQVMGNLIHNAGDGWRLVSTMFYSDGLQSFFPADFRGNNEDATWRVSAVQAMVFDNALDAFNYFTSKTYTK